MHFRFGRARPLAGDRAKYNRVVKILKKHPQLRLKLQGHADEVGDENWNYKLSVWRAEEVQKLLVGRGIDKSRLELEGKGEEAILKPGKHSQNRRLEFKIIP